MPLWWSVYKNKDGTSGVSFANNINHDQCRVVYSFTANKWSEAMRRYCAYMGWEYKADLYDYVYDDHGNRIADISNERKNKLETIDIPMWTEDREDIL